MNVVNHEIIKDKELFKKCANELLNETFIPRKFESKRISFNYLRCYSTYKDLILSNLYTWSRFCDLTITLVKEASVSLVLDRKTMSFS